MTIKIKIWEDNQPIFKAKGKKKKVWEDLEEYFNLK